MSSNFLGESFSAASTATVSANVFIFSFTAFRRSYSSYLTRAASLSFYSRIVCSI